MYLDLTTHSACSLLEGVPLPAELAQTAKSSGMTARGLTDHRTLTGVIEFVRACKEADIQPILGLEIDLVTGGRLPLLAESLEGWSNLCRLSSALALQDNPEAPCTLELLAQYTGDLVALAHDEETFGALKDIFTHQARNLTGSPPASMRSDSGRGTLRTGSVKFTSWLIPATSWTAAAGRPPIRGAGSTAPVSSRRKPGHTA